MTPAEKTELKREISDLLDKEDLCHIEIVEQLADLYEEFFNDGDDDD